MTDDDEREGKSDGIPQTQARDRTSSSGRVKLQPLAQLGRDKRDSGSDLFRPTSVDALFGETDPAVDKTPPPMFQLPTGGGAVDALPEDMVRERERLESRRGPGQAQEENSGLITVAGLAAAHREAKGGIQTPKREENSGLITVADLVAAKDEAQGSESGPVAASSSSSLAVPPSASSSLLQQPAVGPSNSAPRSVSGPHPAVEPANDGNGNGLQIMLVVLGVAVVVVGGALLYALGNAPGGETTVEHVTVREKVEVSGEEPGRVALASARKGAEPSQEGSQRPGSGVDGRAALDAAKAAAKDGDHAEALGHALDAYAADKSDEVLVLVGTSACRAGDAKQAKFAAGKLAGAKAAPVKSACKDAGLSLD